MEQTFEKLEFDDLISKLKDKPGSLIPILQAAQEEYGYLSEKVINRISAELKIPVSEVYGVATFYAQFRIKPVGKNIIKVCTGTACHVRGGEKILKELENILQIKAGGTTEDNLFTIEPVACLGACGLAPVIVINNDSYGRLTTSQLENILRKYK